MHRRLHNLYYNLPRDSAYAGARNLLRSTRKKYNQEKVLNWLEAQDAYTLHKQVRRRFPRRTYNVRNLTIDSVWEIDLAVMNAIKSYNDGYGYLMMVIDVVSKYAWIEPMKDKSSKSAVTAFENILKRCAPRRPALLQSDKGTEFKNREFQQFLKEKNIMYRVARSPDVKAAIVERFIRTIKERLYRYFTYRSTRKFLDVLPGIVESYNQTKHSATRMTPASVTLENAAEARKNIERRYERGTVTRPKYRVNELVHISSSRTTFQKAAEQGWTVELFKISRISTTREPPVYYLKDLAGEDIEGFFYQHELSRSTKNLKKVFFEVQDIVETKTVGRTKFHLIRWRGWPDKFCSWVKASQLKDLK